MIPTLLGVFFIQVSLSQTASKQMSLLWKLLHLEPNLQCPYLWNLHILASMFTSKGDFNMGLEGKTGNREDYLMCLKMIIILAHQGDISQVISLSICSESLSADFD